MNQSTEKLIRELAEKLGTTTEHLWGVMIKQAMITGIINLSVGIVFVLLIIYMIPTAIRKTRTPPATEEVRYPSPEWPIELTWGCLVIGSFIIAVVIACNLSDTISALANPEYWALKQLIH